ncbi:MAG: sigma-54-dependent transcriptional regulator [Terriglobales bacterium]
MHQRTIQLLIVDDDASVREGCRQVAESLGYSALVAGDPATAYRLAEQEDVDVVLLDLKLGGANGLHVLAEMKRRRPETEVVVITGFASVASAVEAMKLGASDYVTKPFHVPELKQLLERVARQLRMAEENRALREKVRSRRSVGGLVGRSPEMEKLYRIIGKVACSAHPVLIQGESGTGKELVARAIHFSGPYRDKPFIPVDCGALVPTLVESELFGYVRGAFTGAVRSKEGLLAIADGGTILLDEIGELPVDLQAKLLRALQEKEIRPVGSNRSVSINVRIVAATNRDLDAAVQHGSFRRDLYFRLNVVNLRIPPLRERKQDIALLVAHFLERMARATGVERTLSQEAMERILAYDWPGNVRELENSLERASALSSGPTLQLADLPSTLQNPPLTASLPGPGDGIQALKEMEKLAILEAVRKLHGDKLRAARLLGIGRTTLYRKLKEYGIQD